MGLSIWHILLILVIVLALFGSRLPKVMGDLGKGIHNLREGLKGSSEGENKKDDSIIS